MALTPLSVLVGVTAVYVKAYTTSNHPVTNDDAPSWGSWTDLGYIEDDTPVTMSLSTDFFRSRVAQHTAALALHIVGEELKIGITMAESSLLLLQHVFPGGTYAAGTSGTTSETLTLGDLAAVPYLSIGIDMTGAGLGLNDTLFIPKCAMTGDVSMPFVKNGNRVVSCEFEALADPNESVGARIATWYSKIAA